jgi:hypothetical protein
VRDDFSLGPCIGLGAMFITGINNNPLTLLARQIGLRLRHTNEDCCELINEAGWRPEVALDKRVEAHFNKTLDKLSEWRKSPLVTTDVPLGGEKGSYGGGFQLWEVSKGGFQLWEVSRGHAGVGFQLWEVSRGHAGVGFQLWEVSRGHAGVGSNCGR